VDAHPLVREYFAKQLRERHPDAWREGHRRLYEHLKASVPHRPEGLVGLQPLYQAVAHGCNAGLHQQACDEVYVDRILRGTGDDGFYSSMKLGAIGADLGAVACFFEEPWKRLAPGLSEPAQAWLLHQAARRLSALGRLTESLEPMRVSGEMSVIYEAWTGAATSYSILSELHLTLGELGAAEQDAERSAAFADKVPSEWQTLINIRATLADARNQSGARADALAFFRDAESMQVQRQPEYPVLYSLRGFNYCDLILGDVERMAWATTLASNPAPTDRPELEPQLDTLREVEQRATQTLKWAEEYASAPLLDIARDHLTLSRVVLYRAILEESSFGPARDSLAAAVDGFRAAGDMIYLPSGLLSRAWLRFVEGDAEGAKADLDEAWQIAERGSMKLHMADIHLHRARLFRDHAALEAAAKLIEETGYHRRDDELADAREALNRQS
jgi:tetratricopeptide (TPR) repeat protein